MRKVQQGTNEGLAWEFWAHEEGGVTTGYFVVTASANRSIAISAMFFVFAFQKKSAMLPRKGMASRILSITRLIAMRERMAPGIPSRAARARI